MYGSASTSDLGLSLTDLPLVGRIFGRIEDAVNAPVRAITERVADFKLLPRRHSVLRARVSRLKSSTAVRANTALYARVNDAGRRYDNLVVGYRATDASLDSFLSMLNDPKTVTLSASTVQLAASVASGMTLAFTETSKLESALTALEKEAGIDSTITAGQGAGASAIMLAVGVGMFLVLRKPKRR